MAVLRELDHCEQLYPEYKGAVDAYIAKLTTEIPEFLHSNRYMEVFIAEEAWRSSDWGRGVSRGECGMIAHESGYFKLIKDEFSEEIADAKNENLIEHRQRYWQDRGQIPCLGFSYHILQLNDGNDMQWPSKVRVGLFVKEIQADSPASRANVLVGDQILAIGGQSLVRESDLKAITYSLQPGETNSLSIERNSQVDDLKMVIGFRRLSLPNDFTCWDFSSLKHGAQKSAPADTQNKVRP